jgi:hypothetical protein
MGVTPLHGGYAHVDGLHANLAIPAGVAGTSVDAALLHRAAGRHGCVEICGRCAVVVVVAFVVVDGVFAHALHDGLLQLRGLKQRGAVGDTGERLVCLEDLPRHAHVDVLARLHVHPQPAQHDGNQPAGACPRNEVEVLAWLRYLVSLRCSPLGLDKGPVHQLLEDDEHRVPPHASAIWDPVSDCASSVMNLRILTE